MGISLTDANILLLKSTALSSLLPEPIKMATNSALLSELIPFINNFSLGRSSILQDFIEKNELPFFKILDFYY